MLQIKTTSPEKFKVRPNTGILLASQKITVTITLQPGYNSRNLLPNDRFLIMCLPIKDTKMTTQELVDFWKVFKQSFINMINRNQAIIYMIFFFKANGATAEQHRLICRDVSEGVEGLRSSMTYSTGASGSDNLINSLFSKV